MTIAHRGWPRGRLPGLSFTGTSFAQTASCGHTEIQQRLLIKQDYRLHSIAFTHIGESREMAYHTEMVQQLPVLLCTVMYSRTNSHWFIDQLLYTKREIIICTTCLHTCVHACVCTCVCHTVFSETTTVTHFW